MKSERLPYKFIWWLVIIAVLLFFFSSFEGRISVGPFFRGVWQGVLVVFAILMVLLAVSDKKERIIQRKKKKRLLKILENQRKTLKDHFAFQEKPFSEPSQSSLNFAVEWEKTLKKEGASKKIIGKIDLTGEKNVDKKNHSQINLARILVEGEDISSFPLEWQEFFVENEGKEPIEKLNKILGDENKK